MKCPECGEEMEEGYLLPNRTLVWSKKKKSWITLFDTDYERLFPIRFLRLPALVAYKCPKCQIGIFYFGERNEKMLEEKEQMEKYTEERMKEIYNKLLEYYQGNEEILEKKIKDITDWSWSREIAIQRLARNVGIIKEDIEGYEVV